MDTLGVVEVLAVGAGLALVLVAAGDAVSTLVTTRRRRGRRWPTPVSYRWSWRAWRAVGQRASPERRELQLLALDDLSDEQTTGIGFLEPATPTGAPRG